MKSKLASEQQKEIIRILEARYHQYPARHQGIGWAEVHQKLEAQPDKLRALHGMEGSGGEPDVVVLDGQAVFVDCAPESPKERRSVCYDTAALESRKEHKPKNSALNMAYEMGIEILNEEQYRQLQAFGPFDTKTSSWILTPEPVRQRGGALFGDYRYGQVFIYHNGAESYYAARGFRGLLRF